MTLILFIFAFSFHTSVPSCYGLTNGTETVGNLSKDYMKTFQRDLPKTQGENKNQIMEEVPYKIHFTANDNALQVQRTDMNNTAAIIKTEQSDPTMQDVILKEGTVKLKTLGYILKHKLDPTLDIGSILENVTNQYADELENYFKCIHGKKVKYEIDKEFYYLDIIDSTNKIFKNVSDFFLDTAVARSNKIVLGTDLTTLKDSIELNVAAERKTSLKYLCQNYKICRPYPAYTDHIAQLIKVILNVMQEELLVTFVEYIAEVLKIKIDFYKTIMSDNILFQIQSQMTHVISNSSKIKELFSEVRKAITQRYQIFSNNNFEEIETETKAVRLLFDVIDKAYDVFGNELADIEFDNLQFNIKEWVAGKRQDMKEILVNFLNDVANVLNFYWPEETKEEVRILIEIIMTGTSENNVMLDDLMTKGSSFAKFNDDDDMFSDLYIV